MKLADVELACPGCGAKLRLPVRAETVAVVPAGEQEAQVIVQLIPDSIEHRCRPARRPPRGRLPGRRRPPRS